MKKIYKYILIVVPFLLVYTSCDLDQLPKDKISPETFFRTEEDLKLYCNDLYFIFPAASLGTETVDNVIKQDLGDEITGRRDPATSGSWGWSNLRKVNFFLENSIKYPNEDIRNKYDGIARFFRAQFYYDMVKQFGDVPWYDKVLTESDPDLYKPRDSRQLVMDKMLEDIDFAIEHLWEDKLTYQVSKWTALALKSRFCLFEGTFRKYHGIADWERFLKESVSASEALIKGGKYSLYMGNGHDVVYRDLFASINAIDLEVIYARNYDAFNQQFHNANYYTLTSSYGRPGLEKQLVDSYLMKDGSRFTDKKDYDKMLFFDEMQDRDPRLTQTVIGPGYTRIGEEVVQYPQFGFATTGYQIIKYVCERKYDMYNKNENDLIMYRYAEVLLNLAEAKAELNTLTQDDIDNTINLLRNRVGVGFLNISEANSKPCPFMAQQYPLVSGANKGVILEIRRERRVELMMERLRYDDVMRWKAGKLFERPFKGMYFPGAGEYDFDNDGKPDLLLFTKGNTPSAEERKKYDQALEIGSGIYLEHGTHGCVLANPGIEKKWNEDRDYLAPIATRDIVINSNLEQNPGWPR